MEPIQFKVGSKLFTIPLECIPEQSYLRGLARTTMAKEKDEGIIVLSEEINDEEEFARVLEYLQKGTLSSLKDLGTFSYLCVNPCEDYDVASYLEEQMRAKMYNEEFKNHPMNTDPHYGLIEITENLWDELQVRRPANPDLLFTQRELKKRSWNQIQESLKELSNLFSIENLFIAGGRIFSTLFGGPLPKQDIDLFFHGIDSSTAEQKVGQIAELVKPILDLEETLRELSQRHSLLTNGVTIDDHFRTIVAGMHRTLFSRKATPERATQMVIDAYSAIGYEQIPKNVMYCTHFWSSGLSLYFVKIGQKEAILEAHKIRRQLRELNKRSQIKITRTNNSLTFEVYPLTYQVVLRLYRTPSEILHGFDVDSCCFGYDGKRLWMTQRALYSICNGWNTVNFNRLSPSYEYRLAKYGTRGMAIRIPNFKKDQVNQEKVGKYYHKITYTHEDGTSETNYRRLSRSVPRRLTGLDLLVYLDFQAQMRNYKRGTIRAIELLAEEASDYSGDNFKQHHGQDMGWIIDYLISEESESKHPEEFRKYRPHLGEIESGYEAFHDDHDANDSLALRINNVPIASKVDFVSYTADQSTLAKLGTWLKLICHVPKRVVDFLILLRPWELHRDIQWKMINPGEQMTGTFHKTVLDDRRIWYNQRFYS